MPQESRKSLYFLKDSLANFFEPVFTTKITVNDSKMDFVRYVALISHWRKQVNINKVGYGYARKMENLYEEFIYFVVDGDGKQTFVQLPDYVINGTYVDLMEDISKVFQRICNEMVFHSIIDMDMVAFGLLEYMIFEQKRIDESSIYDLISELRTKIAEFKEDYLHTKNPSALKHLRNRMYYSKDIYRKYIQ